MDPGEYARGSCHACPIPARPTPDGAGLVRDCRLGVVDRDHIDHARAKGAAQDEQSSVERIVAIGNVLVNQGKEKYSASERLDYDEATGVAVLTGNPRAWQGKNQVAGSKIVLYLREDRTIVHGSANRRVNVTLIPGSGRKAAPK